MEFENKTSQLYLATLSTNRDRLMLDYTVVNYNDKQYLVCRTNAREINKRKLFVVDYDMFDKIKHLSWHCQSAGHYVAHKIMDKELYLHNYVMNKLSFDGKGQLSTIDHINRHGMDNRRENLREATQTQQNYNQKKKKRIVELPEDCGIDPDNLPKGVTYRKAHEKFGECFEIDVKGLPPTEIPNGRFRRATTKSKSVSLKCKLEEAKKYLAELQKKYPQFVDFKDIDGELTAKRSVLIKSYNEIIKLSGYSDWKNNLIEIPAPTEAPPAELQEHEKKLINENTIDTHGKKRTKNKLPPDCGVTKNMIPKYCYYNPATDTRSDAFTIERHPKMTDRKSWKTTGSSAFTTKQKFDLLLKKLEELNAE